MTYQESMRREYEHDDPYDEVDNLVNDNIETINTGLPYTEEQEESIIREKNRSVHRRVRKVRMASEEVAWLKG